MQKYSPMYSKRFKTDLDRTCSYISHILKNSDAAIALLEEVYRETENRGKLAKAFKPYAYDKDNIPLYYVKIQNFYAFYQIDEKNKKMEYMTFIYARMDVSKVLKTKRVS